MEVFYRATPEGLFFSITSWPIGRVVAPPAPEARSEEEDEDGLQILVDAAERIADAVEAERPGTAIRGVVEDKTMAEAGA